MQLAGELLYRLAASPDTQAPALDALRREGALTAQLDLLCRPLPKEVRDTLRMQLCYRHQPVCPLDACTSGLDSGCSLSSCW